VVLGFGRLGRGKNFWKLYIQWVFGTDFEKELL
jgi:hypothetical protein